MTIRRVLFVLCLISLPAFSARGQDEAINADRPGIADGSQTLKRGQFQIELGLQRYHDRAEGIDVRALFVPSLFRFGVTDRFEARVESNSYNHVRITAPDFRLSSSGWSPVSLGFKYHLAEEQVALHRPSLGVIARFFPPSGSGDFKSTRGSGDVRLAADCTLGKWSVNPNLGLAVGPDQTNRSFPSALAAVTVQYSFTETFNAFVDGAAQAPEERGGTTSVILDAGTAWIVTRDTQLDLSAGWRVHGTTVPNLFVGAGVSHRF